MKQEESREKKKGKAHPLCEKHPVLAMLLSVVVLSIAVELLSIAAEGLSGGAAALQHFLGAAAVIPVLLLVQRWFSPSYRGALKAEVSGAEMIRLLVPFFVYAAANRTAAAISGELVFEPTLTKLGMALNAGLGEETIFRAAAIPIGLHFIGQEKKLGLIWSISSAFFGLLHLMNIRAGGAACVIAVQAVAAFFIGVYFAALFMCSGSILLPIAVHSVWDYICFATDPRLENGLMMQPTVDLLLLAAALFNVLLGGAAIVMMHRRRDEIERIWEGKWSG